MLKRFDKITSLTLNVYSGSNLQQIIEYFLKYQHAITWWTGVTRICLGQIFTEDTDGQINYLVRFVQNFKNLRELELFNSQNPKLVLAALDTMKVESVSLVVPDTAEEMNHTFQELYRLNIKTLKILGQRTDYNPIEDVFWPQSLQNLDL